MAVALRSDHPLAHQATVELAGLADDQWCAPHPCMCRDALDLACRRAGFTPDVVSETNDYMVMQGLVAAGIGVAVIPRLVAAMAVRPGIPVRPLGGEALERVTFMATRSAASRAAEVLRTVLRKAVTMIGHPALPLEPFDAHRADTRKTEFATASS